jgi:phosphoribosylformimino-5-aminoimidazole carboxamide ribotide isomerase
VKIVKELEDKVWGFLYTNVDVEGQMKGVDMKSIKDVVKSTKKPVIISGGISSQKDIKEIEKTRAWGVVLGKALYEGKIRL